MAGNLQNERSIKCQSINKNHMKFGIDFCAPYNYQSLNHKALFNKQKKKSVIV